MSSGSGSVAGTTGTPTSIARLRAATLLPSLRIVSGFGPMKMMPAAAQASANSGLSDKQPVAWMDRVGAGQLGDADHLVDREIALDRPHVLGEMRPAPDLVGTRRP